MASIIKQQTHHVVDLPDHYPTRNSLTTVYQLCINSDLSADLFYCRSRRSRPWWRSRRPWPWRGPWTWPWRAPRRRRGRRRALRRTHATSLGRTNDRTNEVWNSREQNRRKIPLSAQYSSCKLASKISGWLFFERAVGDWGRVLLERNRTTVPLQLSSSSKISPM